MLEYCIILKIYFGKLFLPLIPLFILNILAGGEPEREAAAFSQGAINPNTAGKSFND